MLILLIILFCITLLLVILSLQIDDVIEDLRIIMDHMTIEIDEEPDEVF